MESVHDLTANITLQHTKGKKRNASSNESIIHFIDAMDEGVLCVVKLLLAVAPMTGKAPVP